MSQTIEEWLMAADYILSEGNPDVVLCERGIRTFETMTRNTFDVGAIALVRELCHLPVIADPSHASGRASLVPALAVAAVAAGADGLMIEVHTCPERALCDGSQSLTPQGFETAMGRIRAVSRARVYGRGVGGVAGG
jgi:3-deoxy-7-phosphoheptulonate synthase